MTTLREAGEAEVVRQLAAIRAAARPGGGPAADPARIADSERRASEAGIVVGSGDDAAVVRPVAGRDLVATTDAFVEGRHYDPALLAPRITGARLAAANASDLAAMAAAPRWALLSIGARPARELETLVEFQTGVAERLAADGARIVGGNVVAVEGAEWASLTLVGDVVAGSVWTRAGARPGDAVAVTGVPGRAGAAFRLWRRFGIAARAGHGALFDSWAAPVSRVALARALAARGVVTAAIDVSDGFAGDLARLCDACGAGAELDDAAWPADEPLARAAEALGADVHALRFGPSDDYELVLALDPARLGEAIAVANAAGASLAVIGRMTEPPGTIARLDARGRRTPVVPAGFDHFA